MVSPHRIDPELVPFLSRLPEHPLSAETLPRARRALEETLVQPTSLSSMPVDRRQVMAGGFNGGPSVRLLCYSPTQGGTDRGAILHLHGGGFLVGKPEMSDSANRKLASELGCVVVSVDYRLAPETRFPGQRDDAYAALLWLAANAEAIGVDARRIGVKGESAGGGLAASIALYARDQGGPSLAFQHLIYPMLDDRTCIKTDLSPAIGEYVWTRESNLFAWSALLGAQPGSPEVSTYASPSRAESLSELPRTFLSIGDLDLFLDETLHYADRLSKAGVPMELHVYPGAFHRFQEADDARVAASAVKASQEALRRALRKDEPS